MIKLRKKVKMTIDPIRTPATANKLITAGMLKSEDVLWTRGDLTAALSTLAESCNMLLNASH